MATFERKIWRERRSEFPNRRRLQPVAGQEGYYDSTRAEGIISQEGDQWSPGVMTELEDRITDVTTQINDDLAAARSSLAASINLKANIASPALTGVPTAPTAGAGTNNTQISTTAFVATAVANGVAPKANIASPGFTGTPTAPTAATGTNNTQIATTAFTHTTVNNAVQNAKMGIRAVSIGTGSWANEGRFWYAATGIPIPSGYEAGSLSIYIDPWGLAACVNSRFVSAYPSNGMVYIACGAVPSATITVYVSISQTRGI